MKAQFVRKTYTNLAIDDFRGFFAAFCAFTYLDEKFSFLDGEIETLISTALKYVKLEIELRARIERLA